MTVSNHRLSSRALSIVAGLVAVAAGPATAADSVTPLLGASTGVIGQAERASAGTRLPMLRVASLVPRASFLADIEPGRPRIEPGRAVVSSAPAVAAEEGVGAGGAPDGAGVAPLGYGTESHPFTTKGAYGYKTSAPTNRYPWSATGKLWMRYGASWYVCTASLIKRGVLVTAAHCVWEYGVAGSAPDEIRWEPALFGSTKPWGTYAAAAISVPQAYKRGNDKCEVAGVVCANDVALVVLKKGADGKWPGTRVGYYGYAVDGWGYAKLFGAKVAQITQLGYPAAFDGGLKMIRTDSLGYMGSPNNVVIGSDQTGGSSGGPWLLNFGVDPVSNSSAPIANTPNIVVATTSWGYVSSAHKIQGASRFGTNAKYKNKSNIDSLLDAVCDSASRWRNRC